MSDYLCYCVPYDAECHASDVEEALDMLKDLLDSMEWLERHFPNAHGSAVRLSRMERARELIKKLEGTP